MTTIYLMRHSESIGIRNMIIEGEGKQLVNEKLPLSPNGEEMARKFADKEEFKNIDAVFSSKYVRAISTAKYISLNNNLQLIVSKDINERKTGDADDYPKSFWVTQFEDENAKAPNGESRKDVTERFTRFINRILEEYKDKKVVVVSHGSAMTYLLMNWCELVGVDLETKARHLTFKGKEVINENFNLLVLFKLTFDGNNIVNVELIKNED